MQRDKREQWRSFLLSFAVTMAALAAIMVGTVMSVQPAMPRSQGRRETIQQVVFRPQPSDSLTMVVIGVNKKSASDFLLIRFNPQYGQVPLTLFPPQTLVTLDGEGMTIQQAFERGGGAAVKKALTERLGIAVDRYALLSESVFVRIAEKTGSVVFELPFDISYAKNGYQINLPSGERRLDGQDVADIFTFPALHADPVERSNLLGILTAAIVNQNAASAGENVSSGLFKLAVNLVDTDVTSADYELRREAADFVAKLDAQVSGSLPVGGTLLEDGSLELSEQCVSQIRQYFQTVS